MTNATCTAFPNVNQFGVAFSGPYGETVNVTIAALYSWAWSAGLMCGALVDGTGAVCSFHRNDVGTLPARLQPHCAAPAPTVDAPAGYHGMEARGWSRYAATCHHMHAGK